MSDENSTAHLIQVASASAPPPSYTETPLAPPAHDENVSPPPYSPPYSPTDPFVAGTSNPATSNTASRPYPVGNYTIPNVPYYQPPPSYVPDKNQTNGYCDSQLPYIAPPAGPWVNQPCGYGSPNQQIQMVSIIQPSAGTGYPLENPPDAHMGYAVFVTVCCCWLIGIFAIKSAKESRDASVLGDRELAEKKSKEALARSHRALICGIVALVIIAVVIGVRVYFAVTTPVYPSYGNGQYNYGRK